MINPQVAELAGGEEVLVSQVLWLPSGAAFSTLYRCCRNEEMTLAERELWDAFPEGRQVDLRVGTPDEDDPAGGADWGPERTLRATVVTALARGANAAPPGAVTALRVAGARITGRLDLAGAEIGHMLRFESCWFEEAPSFYGATTRTIGISGSRAPGID
ncbi:hypothetical protein ACFRLW_31105, partial [Streptomyces sp. NPDC056728]